LIGVYGDKRKRRKVILIPKHDIATQKWCNLCETVKQHQEFYADKMTKDGLNANCKACKIERKRKRKEEKKKNEPLPAPEKKLSDEKLNEIKSKNPLERFSKNELIELLKEKGIKFSKKKTKGEMIKVLE
jgi:hypothetical protein